VEKDGRCPSSKSSLSSNGNNAKGNIDYKKRLNIQPTNLAGIWIHSVCLRCQKYPKQTASKFKKVIFKIGRRIVHVLSNIQNVAILRCCFVTFCKQRQRNEQRILAHGYVAIVLVAVAVKVQLN